MAILLCFLLMWKPMKKIIDITASFTPEMPVWPSSEPFTYEVLRNHDVHNVQVSRIEMNLHTGTHVDSPKHFLKGGSDIADMELNQFMGEVLVVDCMGTQKIDQNTVVNLNLPPNLKKIIFKTSNSIDNSDKFNEHYAALTTDAANWLSNRGIELIGIDAPSIELYHGRDYVTHQVLLKQNMAILEGLKLTDVKAGKYYLIALPLKIRDAEASPVRAILIEGF